MDCDKLNEGILKEKENRQNEVNKLKKDNNNKEKELRNKFKFTGPIAGFLVETEKTIQSIKQNKCHVCDQEWVSDENRLQVAIASKDLLTEAVQYIETNSSKIDELSKIGPTKDEILVQDLKKVIKTKNEELSKERAEAVAKFEEIKKEEMSKISQVSTPILNEFNEKSSIFEDIESRLNKATLRLAYESGSNKQLVLKINKDTELLSKVNIQIRNYEDKLTLLRNEFNLEMDFQGLLKSFLNNIMEEVLQEIATETNNKLVKLNNTNGVTIQFLTEKITQKNVIKEEIRPVIYKNGKQVSVKSGLSGGQFASIEWAVDLSINNVISRRTGFNPGWLVLDEPFHNHDPITRDSCLELLKQEAQDKLIFIIEHAIETNELFDKRILVESQNDESVIKAVL
jgi:ABC-type dipeptide/oligopeptide/nickel transport system ATPase subunit